MSKQKARFTAVALLLGFVVAAHAAEPAKPRPTLQFRPHATPAQPKKVAHRKAKVLLLGIDGMDPGLVRKWTADGSMPNLAKLIERGTMTEIDCVVGTSSPVVWTTVATGVPPDEHGITGFRIGEDPVNSSHRKRPAFWNTLPKRGVDLATVGWMVTWPTEGDAGTMVSDRAWMDKFKNDVSPKGVIATKRHRPKEKPEQILEHFTTYDFDRKWRTFDETDPRYSVHYLLQMRLLNIYRRDSIYTGAAKELAAKHDLDVLAVYMQGTDYVGHGFWQWFEPDPFQKEGWKIPQDQIDALETVVPAYYRRADEIAGQLLELIDDDALVILLSDHGFQAAPAWRNSEKHSVEARFLSGNHRTRATLIVSGPQVEKGAQPNGEITHFDILPTLLYALDLPQADDHEGRVLTELFTKEWVADRKTETIATYASDESLEEKPAIRSHLDKEIVEELRSLGYIE